MKNWKMRSAIMVIVLVTSLIGIGALFLMASSRNQKALSESTSDNMATYLTAQANTIENFVTEKENNLKLFGKSYDVRRVLLNEKDAQAQEQAQKYTMEYYNSLDNWEGLYIGNWTNQQIIDFCLSFTPTHKIIQRYMKQFSNTNQRIYFCSIYTSFNFPQSIH